MSDLKQHLYPVLLAGGTGTRLWPVSRELYPKQLIKFIGDDSLMQSTVKRIAPMTMTENIRVVCGRHHFHEIARHMDEVGIPAENKIIVEPCGRNTAPAILLALLHILAEDKDALICVFPADHVIKDMDTFRKKVEEAAILARQGHILTFGITPHYPETGYGYIEGADLIADNAMTIKRFREKPDSKTAQEFIKAGNFFWNSGMFCFKASVMKEEFDTHVPDLVRQMETFIASSSANDDGYKKLPNISIDYAIMEKTDKGAVLPSDFGWSDIGSWKSLYDFLEKDENGNVIDGNVIEKNTKNSFVMSYGCLIATNHMENMVVVETPDAVFVSEMEKSRDVKFIVEALKEDGRQEHVKHKTVYHPWGTRTVLEKNGTYCIAKLVLYPESCLKIPFSGSVAHLTAVKGKATLRHKDSIFNLDQGKTSSFAKEESLNLENTDSHDLCVIQIDML